MEQTTDITLMLLVIGVLIVLAIIIILDSIRKSRKMKMFDKVQVGDVYQDTDTLDCPYAECKRFVRILDKRVTDKGKKYVKYEYMGTLLSYNVLEWGKFIRLYTFHKKADE